MNASANYLVMGKCTTSPPAFLLSASNAVQTTLGGCIWETGGIKHPRVVSFGHCCFCFICKVTSLPSASSFHFLVKRVRPTATSFHYHPGSR